MNKLNNYELGITNEDWVEAKLDELISNEGIFCDGDWVESKDQDKDGGIRLIQLADIGDGNFKDKSARHLTLKKSIELNCTYLKDNDIILARMPDPLGRATIFPLKGEKKFVTVVDVAIIRIGNSLIDNKYLLYNINSPFIRQKIEALQSGSTRKRISRKNLSKIDFSIAPLPIQRAIVSKIESLFSDLDNGIANLKKAQAQLKIYRQAVLKKAFEGELTKEWREQQSTVLPTAEELLQQIKEERQNHYNKQIEDWKKAVKAWEKNGKEGKKPTKPKAIKELPPLTEDELKVLPKGWKWSPFSNIGFWTGGGTPSKAQSDYWENGNILWITSKDMKSKVMFDSVDKITADAVKFSSAKMIAAGSVLFVMRSGILRRILPVAITNSSATVNQDLQALTPYLVNSEFIYWFSVSNEYDIRKNCAKDGTTVESVESTLLKQYPFSLCSLEEQHQIVQEIESRLSVTDNLEIVIRNSLLKAESLRQSILKKAFEGKLLSEAEIEACKQEEDYEPASVLLERIKNEKLRITKESKQRKIRNS